MTDTGTATGAPGTPARPAPTAHPRIQALPALRVLTDLDAARCLADAERRSLVAALTEAPDSASGLARRLGESRQRLNYHLRALEDAGVLELHEERRRGNCIERVVRPTARRFLVDPRAVETGVVQAGAAEAASIEAGAPGPAARGPAAAGPAAHGVAAEPDASAPGGRDRFSAAYLLGLAARTIGEVGRLMEAARTGRKRLATVSLDATVDLPGPAAMQAFAEELHEAVAAVVARHHRPGADSRTFRVLGAVHPKPSGTAGTAGTVGPTPVPATPDTRDTTPEPEEQP